MTAVSAEKQVVVVAAAAVKTKPAGPLQTAAAGKQKDAL
jgi:hypothetical protein